MSDNFIDKYEIVSTLGRGSMGVVYKCRDPEIGRLVAIKTLKSVFLSDDPAGNEALQRFRLESRSAGKLHHPNVVTIFEAGRAGNGSPYIVMEYIEGKSLEVLLAEQGPLEPLLVLHTLAQIASAIDYAHGQNVIHRDIKPSNILIDGRYVAHLLDFGVAKLSDTSLTPAGTVVGTPSYMSPEQIRGSVLDGKTDLFSLAVVAFESLTGSRPFPGSEFTTVVSNIINKEPISFAELGGDLPVPAEVVLRKGLSKNKEDRYATALDFINALAKAFGTIIDSTGLIGGYHPDHKWRDAELVIPKTITAAMPLVGSLIKDRPEAMIKKTVNADSQVRPEAAVPNNELPNNEKKAPEKAGQPTPQPILQSNLGLLLLKALGLGFATAVVVLLAYYFGIHKRNGSRTGSLVVQDTPKVEVVDLRDEDTDNNRIAILPQPAVQSSPEVSAPVVRSPIPSEGFTKLTIAALDDSQLLSVLQWNESDNNTILMALNEAAVREKKALLPGIMSLFSHRDYLVRVHALKSVLKPAYVSDGLVFQGAVTLLNDEDAIVRGFAVKVIAESGSVLAKDTLQARLAVEKSEVVVKVLRQSLARLSN